MLELSLGLFKLHTQLLVFNASCRPDFAEANLKRRQQELVDKGFGLSKPAWQLIWGWKDASVLRKVPHPMQLAKALKAARRDLELLQQLGKTRWDTVFALGLNTAVLEA